MLLIECPHCGPRNQSEFTYKGELTVRPDITSTPELWRQYLYERVNTRGWQEEQWFHVAGCRRFVSVERHTATNHIKPQNEAE